MDPVANMFSQIKNAINASSKEADISYSKLKIAILEILKNKGFIQDYQLIHNEDQKYPRAIKVAIKYKPKTKEPVFKDIKRISTPGCRIYAKSQDLNTYGRGRIDVLISTSKGIMSIHDARKLGLGGEIICEVK